MHCFWGNKLVPNKKVETKVPPVQLSFSVPKKSAAEMDYLHAKHCKQHLKLVQFQVDLQNLLPTPPVCVRALTLQDPESDPPGKTHPWPYPDSFAAFEPI